jgi:acylphosphatase
MTERPHGPRRLEAVVHGRVHGVGFRVFVLRRARELGLRGWVANEPAGRLRVVAEGPPATLQELVQALRAGPPAAIVERVDEEWSPATDQHASFEIRSGWHGGD